MMFKSLLLAATMAGGLGLGSVAKATTLLDLTNIPPDGVVPYDLTFYATSTTTSLSDAGYQLPGFDQFTDNSVTTVGSLTNLLSQTWTFTPAQYGSDTQQYNDGTSVNALSFGAVAVGYYDTYTQTFATTPGTEYQYTFNFVENDGPQNGYVVSTSGTVSAAPEPAVWLLMVAGVAGIGLMLRRAKKAEGWRVGDVLSA